MSLPPQGPHQAMRDGSPNRTIPMCPDLPCQQANKSMATIPMRPLSNWVMANLNICVNEYKRGISGWNFNLEDVKAQASLIQDVDDPLTDSTQGGSSNSLSALDVPEKQLQFQYSFQVADLEDNDVIQNQPVVPSTTNEVKVKCDKSDDDSSIASSCNEQHISRNSSPRQDDLAESILGEKPDLEKSGKISESNSHHIRGTSLASTILPEISVPPIKGESPSRVNAPRLPATGFGRWGQLPVISALSINQIILAANSDELDEKAKAPVVQQKGRFKVTSENVDLEKVVPSPILQKSHSMQVITPHPAIPPSPLPSPLPSPVPPPFDASSSNLPGLFPVLQTVLQTNIVQRDSILSLMKHIAGGDTTANRAADGGGMLAHIAAMEKSLVETAHDREKELLHEITELQWRLICAQEELQKIKTENAQVNI
uniref:Uncharacterized protein n=1 Tax=Fagus sylvatica TaxID=28930 RepID=A0A2N9G918_FAGSY